MSDLYKIVCSYPKVRDHLEANPQDEQEIHKYIDEIKGDYSTGVLTAMEKFMDRTFVKLYDGFKLQLPDKFELEDVLDQYHVVLCPNHQSHADYLALQYIFYKKFKIPVYIAAGINLNIFPIGEIFKKCGAFFIRRRFDNYVYKIAFQGYIYYLLKTDKVVEFFFEGGRTRTGKLLPPKFGLFNMILDAHAKFDEGKKPLMFIPVSIAHEMIPEEKAHAKELDGEKKKKEKASQLLKLFSLFNKKLGTVHVRFSEGVVVDGNFDDLKSKTQELAFEIFRRVGKGMPITPSSLLSLILLDDSSGALTWKQITNKALDVIAYCEHMDIPLTDSVAGTNWEQSLKVAMDMFLNNNKVHLVKREKLNQVFYTIGPESRANLLYHKNMILHHFLVPAIMNATWFNIFNGTVKTDLELTRFLIGKRKELKYEFYLPQNNELIEEGIKIIEFALGRSIKGIGELLDLSPKELSKIAQKVSPFSSALSYIYEAYYIASLSLRYLGDQKFSEDRFISVARELFDLEKEHGRVVKYAESFTVPKMKATLNYFVNLGVLSCNEAEYRVGDSNAINELIEKFARDVNDQVSVNLKFSHETN